MSTRVQPWNIHPNRRYVAVARRGQYNGCVGPATFRDGVASHRGKPIVMMGSTVAARVPVGYVYLFVYDPEAELVYADGEWTYERPAPPEPKKRKRSRKPMRKAKSA